MNHNNNSPPVAHGNAVASLFGIPSAAGIEPSTAPASKAPGAKKARRAPKLSSELLVFSDNGIQKLRQHTKNFKPKGKGHEAEDAKSIMRLYREWAAQFYPYSTFDKVMSTIESLSGSRNIKREVAPKYGETFGAEPIESRDVAEAGYDDQANEDQANGPEEEDVEHDMFAAMDDFLPAQAEAAAALPNNQSSSKSRPRPDREAAEEEELQFEDDDDSVAPSRNTRSRSQRMDDNDSDNAPAENATGSGSVPAAVILDDDDGEAEYQF